MSMPEFSLPLGPRDQAWLDLRERLVHVARELHFSAISNQTSHATLLLAIAGNLAALAMSISMHPALHAAPDAPDNLVEASTLLSVQLL
jgi:hypothetical protein